jgi:molybdopterin converting factor small subunit
MEIVVEFTGLAKAIAGSQEVTLSIPDGTTYREVVRKLGESYPELVES